jgi:hypothetical protein
MIMQKLLIALAIVATSTACRSTWTPTPVGTTAAPVTVATYEYPAEVTHANGWRPPEDTARRRAMAADMEYSRALESFRRVALRNPPMRVVVYYNGSLSSSVQSVRRPAAGVLEVDYQEAGPKGKTSGKKTIRLYSEGDETSAPVGAQNIDAVVAQRLETAIIQHLMEGNARVLDKGLLYRKTAMAKSAPTQSDAELRALSGDVDLVIEVTFLPSASAADGFEMGLRAIRTKDAMIVAQVSSVELERRAATTTRFVAAEGGYVATSETKTISLRDLCHSVMRDAMTQVASRY